MRKVYILPNLFTTASIFCGVLAMLNVFNVAAAGSAENETHRYVTSCWLILAAAVLDLLDGLVARMTHTESLFGAEYDSLADVVAFGVAPAVLLYTRLLDLPDRHVAEFICIVFPACGALRLARFNVQKTKVEKKSFTGLPIPAAAGVIVSAFLFFQTADPEWDVVYRVWGGRTVEPAQILSGLMLLCSMLMVSTVNYPSFKQLDLHRRKPFDLLPVIVFAAALVLFLKNQIEAMVFAGFLAYVGIGLVGAAFELARRGRRAGSDLGAAAGPGPSNAGSSARLPRVRPNEPTRPGNP